MRPSLTLTYVHSAGMVHRDVKPANILCESSGHVYLADFGIVRLVDATRLTVQGTIGTVSYLSPEQVRGEDVDASSDVYSLGLVLLECRTGQPEYPGSSAEAAVARLTVGHRTFHPWHPIGPNRPCRRRVQHAIPNQ